MKWGPKDKDWFVALVESIVSDPDDITGVDQVKGRLPLELRISVKSGSRHLFSEEVCLRLTDQVKERSGDPAPVVYVKDYMHPTAQQAINDAVQDYNL